MPPWGRGIVINQPEWLEHIKRRKPHSCYIRSRGPIAVSAFLEFPGKGVPITTEGDEWRAARKRLQSLFSVSMFKEHVQGSMAVLVPITRSLLENVSKGSNIVDWNDISGRFSYALFMRSALSICTPALGADTSCLSVNDELREALLTLNALSMERIVNPFWKLTELFDGKRQKFNRSRRGIRAVVDQIVKDRLEDPAMYSQDGKVVDFLSVLLSELGAKDPIMIRDILVMLIFAGRDNTQNAISWAMHELLKHPEWFDRMRSEAMNVLGPHRPDLPYESLAKCHVHLAVFHETIRLWPGVPKNARLALEDDELPEIPGHNKIKIKKGEYVFWSDYNLMRNPRAWGDDANIFNPARHLDEKGRFIKPNATHFIPFGAGPRVCPAAQLSVFEFVSFTMGVLPYFDFKSADENKPNFAEAYTIAMDSELQVEVSVHHGEHIA